MGDEAAPAKPKRTRPLFILLAWISPILPAAAFILFWMVGLEKPPPGTPRRPNPTTPIALGAYASGLLLAVISLFGIRSGRGAAALVPGAVLGIVISCLAFIATVLVVLLSGMRF